MQTEFNQFIKAIYKKIVFWVAWGDDAVSIDTDI